MPLQNLFLLHDDRFKNISDIMCFNKNKVSSWYFGDVTFLGNNIFLMSTYYLVTSLYNKDL